MITRKNKLLKEAGQKFNEIWDIAHMLDETVTSSNRCRETMLKLAVRRIRELSCKGDEFLVESQIYPPEAKEEDLHFVTPTDRREMEAEEEQEEGDADDVH